MFRKDVLVDCYQASYFYSVHNYESFYIERNIYKFLYSNAEVRRNEHNNPTKSSELSKHLRSNINHYFTWVVISNAPKNAKTRKDLEASYIALLKPNLNEQKDFERLVLFRNGVT